MHSLREMFEEGDTEALLLLDGDDTFNSFNRLATKTANSVYSTRSRNIELLLKTACYVRQTETAAVKGKHNTKRPSCFSNV